MTDAVIASSTSIVRRLREARVRLEGLASHDLRLDGTIRALKRIETRLARPLRIAILGEFNTGKSTLANVLARIDSLPTAVVSATRYPTLLMYSRVPEVRALHFDGRREVLRSDTPIQSRSIARLEVGLPSDWLETVELLDLPGLGDPSFGTSSLDLADNGVDALIWCTACTQAWKESERVAWDRLSARLRNRTLLVATHADLVRSPQDLEKLVLRLRTIAEPARGNLVVFSSKRQINGGERELRDALDRLVVQIGHERNAAALRVAARLSERALMRLPPH